MKRINPIGSILSSGATVKKWWCVSCLKCVFERRFWKSFAIFFPLLFFLCFSSCRTSAHLPVPGESSTVNRSLSIEYMTIADAYNDLGKYDKACEYYMLAMKNKNLYWSAYYKLGRCYAMSKNWTEARKVYQKLLKRDKDNLSIQISLAYIYAMEGRLEASENIYEYLVRENPDNPDTLVNYIDVLFASEKYDEAETKLAELKEKFSDNKNIEAFDKKLAEVRPPEVVVDAEDAESLVSEEDESEETDEAVLAE